MDYGTEVFDAVREYRRQRQAVENSFGRKAWYPGYSRDYDAAVGECQRSLGASVANIYGVYVTARTPPGVPTGE